MSGLWDEFSNPPKPESLRPKFCGKCGTELSVIDTEQQFDIHTGKVILSIVTLECPNYISDGHWDNGHGFYKWEEKL